MQVVLAAHFEAQRYRLAKHLAVFAAELPDWENPTLADGARQAEKFLRVGTPQRPVSATPAKPKIPGSTLPAILVGIGLLVHGWAPAQASAHLERSAA